jgi:hypothetical protein
MSFGWAPTEQLFSQNGGYRVDFFSRLEADQKCKFRLLVGFVDIIAKEASCEPLPRSLKQKNIPLLLHDVIVQELNRMDDSSPVPSGNIDSFIHGDFDLLLSVREETRRLLQKTVAEETKNRRRSKSSSPRSVYSTSPSVDSSTANQVTIKYFAA